MEHALPPEVIVERVRAQLDRGGVVTGSTFRRTLLLTIRDEDRHFWTPHLDVQLVDTPAGTRLDGTFAPHPQIWTAFVAVQFLFALLSVGAGVFLISRVSLGGSLLEPALVLGAMLFGGGFSYGAAYVGQGIGSEQMYELRAFLDEALREPKLADSHA